MNFSANPHFILQISHAKTFKMKYTRCPYNNIIQHYVFIKPERSDRLCMARIFMDQKLDTYIDFILVFVDACPAGNVAAFSFNDDSVARSYDIRVSFCTYSL